MKSLNFKILTSLLLFLFCLSLPGLAAVDENIPESWYEANLASDFNINEFDQSPILDENVAQGELDPVEQRLPDDPLAIEPYEEIGQYGGTAHVYTGNEVYFDQSGWLPFYRQETLMRAAPDLSEYIPKIIEDLEYNEDHTELTVSLRKGMRWSDGEPFTTKDVMFWWEHVANNEDLVPVAPENQNPPLENIEALDDYTYVISFVDSQPNAHGNWFNSLDYGVGSPAHYLKDYHIEFAEDEEAYLEKVKAEGFDNWTQYWDYHNTVSNTKIGVRPVLSMYRAKKRTENYVILERNPYYHAVDSEGNQLPYIDEVMVHLVSDAEMVSMKAVTGEATLAHTELSVSDLPLYESQQEKGDYDLLVWDGLRSTWANLQVNWTHEDPNLRELFQNVKFRRALSMGIDRDEINEKIFFGEGTPMAAGVSTTHSAYKPEYGTEHPYVEYNPDAAKELLDEIGMKDINNDGYRELPNGEAFNPDLITVLGVNRDTIMEIVVDQLKNIGLDINLKLLGTSLHHERKQGNNWDMASWSATGTDLMLTYRHALAPFSTSRAWYPETFAPLWVEWAINPSTGEEPPAEIKRIQSLAREHHNKFGTPESKKILEKLLKINAEKMWTIGTVGHGPQPIIKDKKLKNVPQNGFKYWAAENTKVYYEAQFYLEQ